VEELRSSVDTESNGEIVVGVSEVAKQCGKSHFVSSLDEYQARTCFKSVAVSTSKASDRTGNCVGIGQRCDKW
jgi:hypothetical protein